MNWQSVTFDWNQARAFLATAEEGSLSAASRALGLTQPTVGRQVAALEQALGVTLFERVGRGLVLTPTGCELLDHVRGMRAAAARLSLAATGHSQAVEGLVRITASEVMSALVLPEALAGLQRLAPRIEIDLVAADDLRDLQSREADIAIRHVRPENPELIARSVQEATARLYAATDYLDRRGRPQSPQDLSGHDFIGFGDTDRLLDHLVQMGLPVTRSQFRIGSSSGLTAWSLVRAGLGISVMSDHVGRAAPGIEPVLPEMEPVRFPVWLTTHRELHTSRRIRIVFDHLAAFFLQQAQ